MKPEIEEVDEIRSRRRGYMIQVITTLAMGMSQVVYGMSAVFPGVFTEQLSSADADIKLSLSEISWISAITFVGNIVGSLVSSYVNPLLGVIRVCQLCAPLVAGGCLLIAYGDSFWILFTGRLLLGVFNGLTLGPCNIHVGEVASPRLRGFLSSSLTTLMMFGMTCTYLAGWLLGWRKMCIVMGITPMVFMFVVTLMLPRSPRWLITRGHPVEEAERSLRFYSGQHIDVHKEVKDIQESLGDGHNPSFVQALAQLRHRHHLIPLLLIITDIFFLVFSGGVTTTVFAPVIFTSVGWSVHPYVSSIIVGVVRMLGCITCGIILNKLHRRTLLVVNGVVGGIGCLVAGCYFFYRDQLLDYAWIPVAVLPVIVLVTSLGVSPMRNVLIGEILPNSTRSELSGLCLAFFGIVQFVMVYTFPLAKQAIGMSGVYWFFTVMHLLLFNFAMFCLPDTNGKTIEEIQKMFTKKGTGTPGDDIDTGPEKEVTKL